MKYIKTYETIEDNSYKLKKLSDKFCEFFNELNPKLKCYTRQYNQGKDCDVYNDTRSLLSLTMSHIIKITLLYDINRYFPKEEIENIYNFLSLYSTDKSDPPSKGLYFPISEVNNIIEILTLKNYKDFLITLTSNKYNL